MSTFGLLVLLAVALSFGIAMEIAERAKLRKLLDWPDAETLWRERFTNVPADEVRSFLLMFVESFAIGPEYCFRFTLDDRPSEIYQSKRIPHLTMDDDFEFESLTMALESRYQVDLQAVWKDDITLGELFEMTRKLA